MSIVHSSPCLRHSTTKSYYMVQICLLLCHTVTGFTMEIPIPKSMQYLCQYAQKTDLVSCTATVWMSYLVNIQTISQVHFAMSGDLQSLVKLSQCIISEIWSLTCHAYIKFIIRLAKYMSGMGQVNFNSFKSYNSFRNHIFMQFQWQGKVYDIYMTDQRQMITR